MHVAIVVCTVCAQIDIIEYKTKRPVKCRSCAKVDHRARMERALRPGKCGVCNAKLSRRGRGNGKRLYCNDHPLPILLVDEIRELHRQFPDGAAWEQPKYKQIIETKRPRQ